MSQKPRSAATDPSGERPQRRGETTRTGPWRFALSSITVYLVKLPRHPQTSPRPPHPPQHPSRPQPRSVAQVGRNRPLRRHWRLAFAKGALALALVQVRDAAVRLLRVAALTMAYSLWLHYYCYTYYGYTTMAILTMAILLWLYLLWLHYYGYTYYGYTHYGHTFMAKLTMAIRRPPARRGCPAGSTLSHSAP